MPDTTTETTGTRVRHVRIPDIVWIKAATRAKRDGVKLAAVVRDLLRDYGNGHISPY